MLPGILAAAFAGTIAISVVLTAVLLDKYLIRFDRGSVTTMLPGFVYGVALILKVSLLEAAALGVFAFVTMAMGRRAHANSKPPVFTIVSLLLPALAPLIGTIVVLIAQAIGDKPDGDTLRYFTQISRAGAFALMATLVVTIAVGSVSLVRRERPKNLSVIPIVTSLVLLALFLYWEFYKIGFDQDRWSNV